MFLRDSGLLHPAHRVLHMAPEEGLHRYLKHRAVYVGADVQTGPRVTHTFDVQQIPFLDHSFDLVLCSHVLEHVPDDRRALREFARVLAPGGRAVFQHPIDTASDVTAEDPAVVSPAERERRYGQFDHVRMYGRDFADRVRDVGLEVESASYGDSLTSDDLTRFALRDTSPVSRGEIYTARAATS